MCRLSRIAIALLGLVLAGLTVAQAQPAHLPYSITASAATLDEAGLTATLQLTGGVHFTRGAETMTADHATLTLKRPNAGAGPEMLTPSALNAAGSMRYNDPTTGQSAFAQQGSYGFTDHVLALTGSVRYEKSGDDGYTLIGGACLARLDTNAVDASRGVSATIHSAAGLLPSDAVAEALKLTSPDATWDPVSGNLSASGGGVTLTQGDLTLSGTRIVAIITNGTVQALSVTGPLTCSGDLEGLGTITTLTASSATYDPAKHLLTLEGPITVRQGGRTSTATQALATLAPTRRMRLIGLRVSGSLESGAPPPNPDH
ncbi:MAG: LptA/OstA family protein [bacterium]